jgi:hypothetical protein
MKRVMGSSERSAANVGVFFGSYEGVTKMSAFFQGSFGGVLEMSALSSILYLNRFFFYKLVFLISFGIYFVI